MASADPMSEQQGVQSVETGMTVLKALSAAREPLSLKSVAERSGLASAKAHRYLVSLIRAGMVEQDPLSGRYRLGQGAVEVGLSAIAGLDVMEFAEPALAALRAELDETVLLAVWGNHGPVVVRWADSGRPVATNIRTGSVMPLVTSGTGRTFAAFLPEGQTRELIAAELARNPDAAVRWPARLAETREHGMSRVDGDLLPGVAALAAPVFDAGGEIVAVMAVLGRQSEFDNSLTGPVARALRATTERLSRRLGYRAKD
jgi:DNA-binding IclR family transcriptional regulator